MGAKIRYLKKYGRVFKIRMGYYRKVSHFPNINPFYNMKGDFIN